MDTNNGIIKYNYAVAEFTKFMKKNAIDFFVCGGIEFVNLCGFPSKQKIDGIDFYVFHKDAVKALKILKEYFVITQIKEHGILAFKYYNVSMRMHYKTAILSSKTKQLLWDDMIDFYFDDVLDGIRINGVDVPILPATVEAICLFLNIIHYSSNEVIKNRLIIDYIMFLHARHQDIIVSELKEKLYKLGYLNKYICFGHQLVDNYELDLSKFPFPV